MQPPLEGAGVVSDTSEAAIRTSLRSRRAGRRPENQGSGLTKYDALPRSNLVYSLAEACLMGQMADLEVPYILVLRLAYD